MSAQKATDPKRIIDLSIRLGVNLSDQKWNDKTTIFTPEINDTLISRSCCFYGSNGNVVDVERGGKSYIEKTRNQQPKSWWNAIIPYKDVVDVVKRTPIKTIKEVFVENERLYSVIAISFEQELDWINYGGNFPGDSPKEYYKAVWRNISIWLRESVL